MDWTEVAKQVPALGVLVALVYWFLRHLREERELSQKLVTQVIKRDDKLLEDHTKLITEVSTALGRTLVIAERLEGRLDRDS